MSRDEAIKVLKEYLALDKDIDSEYLEAQKVAIEALEEQKNPNSIRINFIGKKEAKEFDNYLKNQQEPALDKIITEIEGQDKWLAQVGYNAYNVDIAFNSIKRVVAESEVKQVDDNEFETLTMMIEHLESVEDMAYKKHERYFENKNYDKAHIFMGLSNRINLEIQMLGVYMDMEGVMKNYD